MLDKGFINQVLQRNLHLVNETRVKLTCGVTRDLLGYSKQVAQEDWERTPASVKQLVEEMTQRLGQLEKKLAEKHRLPATAQRENQTHLR